MEKVEAALAALREAVNGLTRSDKRALARQLEDYASDLYQLAHDDADDESDDAGEWEDSDIGDSDSA